jgi:hypothetical protein
MICAVCQCVINSSQDCLCTLDNDEDKCSMDTEWLTEDEREWLNRSKALDINRIETETFCSRLAAERQKVAALERELSIYKPTPKIDIKSTKGSWGR